MFTDLTKFRKWSIHVLILYYSQEVETCEFINCFRPELKRQGYQGIFSPKSRAKTMHENDSRNVDGCAIFWKQDKLQVIL